MPKAKKIIELPKLPYGMGTFDWYNDEHTLIRFRKNIGEGKYKKPEAVYGESISEVTKKMDQKETQFKEEIRNKIKRASGGISLEQNIEEWLFRYKYGNMKNKSFDRMEQTFDNQIKPYDISKMQVQAIDGDNIQDLLNQLVKDGKSHSTRKKVYSLLNQFFNHIYAAAPNKNPMLIVQSPKPDPTKIIDEELIILDDDEIKAFMEEARKPVSHGVEGYQHGLFLVFLLWTFVRVGEGLAIQHKDILLDEGVVKIYKGFSYVRDRNPDSKIKHKWELTITKTGAGKRNVELSQQAIKAYQEYKSRNKSKFKPNDYVFCTAGGKPIGESNLARNLNMILKKANINKKITIHGLRHSGISFFIRHGVPVEVVSKMAGHESIAITNDIYYSVINQQKKDAISKINENKGNVR